jgi:hypothetical protein
MGKDGAQWGIKIRIKIENEDEEEGKKGLRL